MEKFSFDKIEKNSDESGKKDKKISLRVPTWVKATALSIGMASSQPSFSQELGHNADNNKKNEIELFQDISSFYNKSKEKRLNVLDFINKSTEDKEDSVLNKKVEDEIRNSIKEYENIANNPKEFYEKSIEKIEEVRSKIMNNFLSVEFLEKLKKDLTSDQALAKQKELVDNLLSIKIIMQNPDSITKHSKSAGAYYLIKEHTVYIPFDFSYEYLAHELLHGAYRADGSLSQKEKDILYKFFKRDKNESKDHNVYLHDPAERIVRKKMIDFSLENWGIKKYGEEFTKDHYEKLLERKKHNEVDQATMQIMDTTTENQFIKLMNSIALEDSQPPVRLVADEVA